VWYSVKPPGTAGTATLSLESNLDQDFKTLDSLKKQIDEMNKVMEESVKDIAEHLDFHRSCSDFAGRQK